MNHNNKYSRFTFIDLFSGIGGFRKAMDQLGGECVFSSDLDKEASDVYESNFGERPHGDITKINESDIPSHDVLCAGFPCQAFSISGNRKGFADETKGTLFFDVIRISKHHKPKVIFLENVKNIIQHDKGNTLKIILGSLDEIGYNVHHSILNASDFGIPQARERAYFICTRKDLGDVGFTFPKPTKHPVSLIDFLETGVPHRILKKYTPVYKPDVDLTRLSEDRRNKPIQIGHVHYGGQGDRIYNPYGHAITLSANGGGNFSKSGGYYIDGYPRRLTSRECANIMGFPENFKLHKIDNTARRQFGNSVVVPLIRLIFEHVVNTGILSLKPQQFQDGFVETDKKGSMNENAKEIIQLITGYLEANPDIRFGQALFNLNINQFEDQKDPSSKGFLLRDIYNDTDQKILSRIKND